MTKKERLKYNLIGDRKFYRHVIAVLVPIIIQNTVTNVVSLIDNVMVGKVGTLEMSAVAIVNQLLFVFYLCVFGGLAGAGIFVSQYAGAEDNRGITDCVRMKLYIAAVMLAAAFLIFLLFPEQLLNLYLAEDTKPEDAQAVLSFGMDYLRIMLIGIAPFALSQVYESTLRELGETKVPMFASVAAIVVNLVFNYILIFGNEGLPFLPFAPMGVSGAAIATVMSRFTECLIIVLFVHIKKKRFTFIKEVYRSFQVPKDLFRSIIQKGMPLLLNEFLWSAGMAVLMQCYSVRGLAVVGASNIATTANNIFNVVFISMGNAIAIIVGQHLGANKIEKAKNTVWRLLALSVATCAVMGTLMAVCAPFIPMIYETTDEVRSMATGFLFVVAGMMPFYAFAHGCYFTLRSGGKTFITMLFDCIYTWVIVIPFAFLMTRATAMPIIPLYLAVQSLDIIKCIMGFVYIKKGIWIQNIVKNETHER